MIKQSTIEDILNVAHIEEVIGDYIDLKKRGVNQIGLCPFHNEKTPSFTVSPTKGIYKCFGCGRAGNVTKFLMDHEQLSYPESLRQLAARYNIEIEETQATEEEILAKDKKESFFIINSFAVKYFSNVLMDKEIGRNIGLPYFKERGFRQETIDKFQLGFADSIPNAFYEYAKKSGYTKEHLKELGLISERPERVYDFFRERVMFPIQNLSGKVIGFAGRTLKSDKKIPKYINSPETLIYNKSKVLYGAYFARNSIRQKDVCYIVEGYTDVITLHQAGIENTVASSGTSLTEDQIRLIKRFTPNITMLFDGDAAGLNAASKGLEKILEAGMNVKVVVLPEGHDPDSYLKGIGSSGFEQYIKEKAKDFVLFKLELDGKEVENDPAKKSTWIRDIVGIIALIPDPITRSVYVRECSQLMDISEQLLMNELNKEVRKKLKKSKGQVSGRQILDEEDTRVLEELDDRKKTGRNVIDKSNEWQEKDVIRVLLQHGTETINDGETVVGYVISELGFLKQEYNIDVNFKTPLYQKILELFIDGHEKGKIYEARELINTPDENINAMVADILARNYSISENWAKKHQIYLEDINYTYEKDVKQALCRYLLKLVMKEMDSNHKKIKEKVDFDQIKKLQTEHLKLKGIETQLADILNSVILR